MVQSYRLGNGDIRHDEYLCPDPKDPREELVVALLESLGQDGSICVYSGYERAILERLADLLPILRSELQRVITRLWDLFPSSGTTIIIHPSRGRIRSNRCCLPWCRH